MVRVGTTKRQRFTPYKIDPVARQHEQVIQKGRDEQQVELAKQKVLLHPDYVPRSTGALLVTRILEAFPSARKDPPKTKTQVAIQEGVRRLRIDYPTRYHADKQGLKIGQRIARDCLREAGNEIYGAGSNTPPSAR